MSRYLIVVHDDSATATVDDWLTTRRSPASEQWTTRLNGTFSLRIVSPEVATAVRGRAFFTGVATSESSSFVVLDGAAWQRVERARNRDAVAPSGTWLEATWTKNTVRIRNDLFGTMPVLQAHGPGFVAFSDSLLVLADLRHRFGLVNTPASEPLLARTGLSWRSSQALSTDTVVREISALAPGRGLTVQVSRPLVVDEDETSLGTVLAQTGDPVAAARVSAGFVVSALRALGSAHDTSVHLASPRDVLLLDALERAAPTRSVPVLAEQSLHPGIADRSGVDGAVEPVPTIEDGAAVAGWAASSLGLYDAVVPSERVVDAPPARLRVDAAGNTVARRIWGSASADQMRADAGLDGDAADAYVAQVQKGVRAIGGDPDTVTAAQQHYVAYRSPRFVAASAAGATAVHPLHTRSGAAVADITERFEDADGLDAVEMLLRNGPAPDADPQAVGRSTLALTELGGPLQPADLVPVEVLGTPAASGAASTELARSVAEARGLAGDHLDRAVLGGLMQDLLDVLPAALVPAYEPVLANARWHLDDKQEPIALAGPSVGKLLSLVLFAV